MDSSIIIPLLIHNHQLRCPQCGGTITSCHSYHFHAMASRSPQAGESLAQNKGFHVTLVCGDCQVETQVDEQGFTACIR